MRADFGETQSIAASLGVAAVNLRCSGDWLAAAGLDGKCLALNLASGSLSVVKLSRTPVNLCFTGGELAVLLTDGLAVTMPLGSTETTEFRLPQNACRLEAGSSCFYLAVGSSLHRYSREFTAEAEFPAAHRAQVTDLKLSPSGEYLASSDTERMIFIWSATSHELLQSQMVYHTSRVTELCWSPDSCYLVSGSVDKSVIVWKVLQEERLIIADAHRLGVTSVVCRGSEVISTGEDLTIKVWRVPLF